MVGASLQRALSICCILLADYLAMGQTYSPPIQLPILLSGTYGEMRAGHFHAGIDIRTNGIIGYPVLAVADGYVSRIKVSATGYGNALYINHPNGTTSVYGHLDSYNDTIRSFVKKQQYQKERFEVDEFPNASLLKVKKGDTIAYSGNSGSSGGPHLHFEIRNTQTEIPLNPALHGFKLKDNIAPDIRQLYIYALADSLTTSPKSMEVPKPTKPGWYALKSPVLVNCQRIGIGLFTTDKMNGNSLSNDVYKIEMRVNDSLVYRFTADNIPFDMARYVQAHEDYAMDIATGRRIHRCWKLPGNLLNIYKTVNNGIIQLSKNKSTSISIKVWDQNLNVAQLSFKVAYDPNSKAFKTVAPSADPIFLFDKKNEFRTDELSLSLPAGALYDNVRFTYRSEQANDPEIYSSIHYIDEDTVPVHKYYKLGIKPLRLPQAFFPYAVIVLRNRDNSLKAYNSIWQDTLLTCQTRDFGTYYVMLDMQIPTIQPLSNDNDYSDKDKIAFKISDALSGIEKYQGLIDGKWALFEYDAKNDLLYHTFEKNLAPGEHQLDLLVSDKVNNKATFSLQFKK
ncbi:MAG: M23 family metallopeptidase [Chitinophagales bacterium]|nr:M23 family metallopeptidase [Chitinophagales bacterium]